MRWDATHNWYLGQGRTAAGSSIVQLVREGPFTGTVGTRMTKLWHNFMLCCTHKPESITGFTRENLSMQNFADLSCKGADTALFAQWLERITVGLAHGAQMWIEKKFGSCIGHVIMQFVDKSPFLLAAAYWSCANTFFRICKNATQLFFTEEERLVALQAGTGMCTAYQHLAADFLHMRLYKIKPKSHGFAHQVYELRKSPARNLWADTCWMDEDQVGKMCRVIVRECVTSSLPDDAAVRYLSLMLFKLEL